MAKPDKKKGGSPKGNKQQGNGNNRNHPNDRRQSTRSHKPELFEQSDSGRKTQASFVTAGDRSKMTKANPPTRSPTDQQTKKNSKKSNDSPTGPGNSSNRGDRHGHGGKLPEQQKRVPYPNDRDSSDQSQTQRSTTDTSARADTRNSGSNPARDNALVSHNSNPAQSNSTTGTQADLNDVNAVSQKYCLHPGFCVLINEQMKKFKGWSLETV